MPSWERIATSLRARMASGELPPGTRLPSATQLAESEGVSRNTVVKAMAQLRAEGIVESRPGYGTFVRAPGELADHAALARRLQELAAELIRIGQQLER